MRLRNVQGAKEAIDRNEFVIKEPRCQKGHWNELFGTDAPIDIEVGMGKGRFLITLAQQNPEINYVGIEKFSSVLIRALEKQNELRLPNLYFLREDATELTEFFGKSEVDRIYLNFSDPWPKDRHAKRRLPSRQFLARYDAILAKDGRIEFKTDNQELFDFALEEIEPAGWELEAATRDLHHDEKMMAGNIMTEYEERFSSLGHPIYKYIIYRQQFENGG